MMWLKQYLETSLKVAVEISKPKKQFGDYSTNVLLKEKLDKTVVEACLEAHELIADYKLVNGHVNIYLHKTLIIYDGPLAFNLRMTSIHDRLEVEGYTQGQAGEDWHDLIKLCNELNYSLDNYGTSFNLDESIKKTFEKLDLGYIYRVQSDEVLGGIYLILHQVLIALGRLQDE